MKKRIMLWAVILPLTATAQINIDSIKVALSTFSAGLKAKDHAIVQQTVASEFSIYSNTWPSAQNLLNKIWQNQSINSLELASQHYKKEGDIFVVDAVFILENQTRQNSKIGFNRNHKIVFVDYFDRLFGSSRYVESMPVATLPFKNAEGSIILTLQLNASRRPLHFLLDTGADGMAIRKTLADSLGLTVTHTQQAHMVGGQQQIEISKGNAVRLSESLTLKNQNIALFPRVRHQMDGIIGLNLIKRYITEVNYDKNEISFYTFGNRKYEKKDITLPVKTPYGLILLPSSINLTGDKVTDGNFIMDTGAAYYLILFSPFVHANRLLQSGFRPESQARTVSLGISSLVYNGKCNELLIGDYFVDNNIPITLQTDSKENSNISQSSPDGSLGVNFFSKFNFIIDLLKNEVHLIKR